MPQKKNRSPKLALRREFLRRLTPSALDRVVGGTDILAEADGGTGPCTPCNESCLNHGSKTAPTMVC